ncbi:MAG: hypothetical protein FD130_701, partial [Halothiobacillaceae bacterium]
AMRHLTRSVALAPENSSLHLAIAGFYEQLKTLDKAVEHYRLAVSTAADSEAARAAEKRLNLTLVKQYAASGDVDTALQLLNSMLEEYPNDARILQHLGFAYLIANRFEAAAAVYESVLDKEPNNDAAHMNLAGVYEKMGNVPAAVTHLRRAAELTPNVDRKNDALIKAELLEADEAQKRGDLEGAIAALQKVLVINPAMSVSSNRLAGIYREQGKIAEAEKILLAATGANPDNLDARMNLASLYAERKNFIDAIWQLGQILGKGDKTAQYSVAEQLYQQLANALGEKLESVRSTAKKKNELIQALFLDPDNVTAHYELGVIYTQQRIYDKAQESFENVRRLRPDNPQAYLYLGEIYNQLQKHAEAVEAFATYISLENDISKVEKLKGPFAMALGQYLYKEKKFEAALTQFIQVLEIQPNDAYAQYHVALISAQKGELDEAVVAYEKVLASVPSNTAARINLAMAREQLGQLSAASELFGQVAAESPAGKLKETAETRYRLLKKRLNGLTTSAGYSVTIDDNSNLSEFAPSEEQTSTLYTSFDYNYRYSDQWQLNMQYSPSYATYHVGHYDYLSQSIEPSATYDKRRNLYTVSYRYNKLEGLLNELAVSSTNLYSLSWNHEVEQGRRLISELTYQEYSATTNSLFNSTTSGLNLSYSKSLGKGVSGTLGYGFSANENSSPVNDDTAYRSHSLSYRLSKWLSESSNVGLTVNGSMTNYLHSDRFTRVDFSVIPETRRENTQWGLTLSYNYRINANVRFFASANYQQNDSNLPVLVFDNRGTRDTKD